MTNFESIVEAIQSSETIKYTDAKKYKDQLINHYKETELTDLIMTTDDSYGYWVLILPVNDYSDALHHYLETQDFDDDEERAYLEELLNFNARNFSDI